MQVCARCGDYNTDENIFCQHCGHRLNNRCPDCGFPNLPEQKFCGNCNKQLLADTAIGGIPPVPPSPETIGGTMQQSGPPPSMQPGSGGPAAAAAARTPLAVQPMPAEPAASVDTGVEETHFDSYNELETYALASIEFANWEQLKAETVDASQLESYHRQCLALIEERLLTANAKVTVAKNGIVFATFSREQDPVESLQKGIHECLDLLGETLRCGETAFKLKIGLDVEQKSVRNPLTSTMERSVAPAGALVVSERVYEQIKTEYKAERIGPVPVGNRMVTFYRVLRPGAVLPNMDDILAGAAEKKAPRPRTPQPPPQSISPPPAEMPEQPKAAVPEPPAPDAGRAFSAQEKQPEAPPPLVHYEAPVLGLRKAPRPPVMNYEKGVDALTGELESFLSQPGQKGKVVSLCASDGAGKSNILVMGRAQVDPQNSRATWIGGQNYRSFYRSQLPLVYWLEAVQNLLSLMFEGQPSQDVREQIGKFMNAVYGPTAAQEDVDFLVDFLSVRPPQPLSVESRDNIGRIESFFLNFLTTLSHRKPVILVMEDIHLADTASLELLTRLLEKGLLDHPVQVLLTQSRDFYADGRFAAVLQKIQSRELVISDLADAEAERFLNAGPLGGRIEEFSVPLLDRMLRSARGQAIYFEEALRLLHLQGIITIDAQSGKYVMTEEVAPSGINLPDNLEQVIAQRITYLNEKTRYILQLASVLGEKFSVGLLMALALADADEEDKQAVKEFNESLVLLFDHGYLVPDPVNTGHFRHGIIWQVVYDGIDSELKLQLHQLVSAALEDDFNQQITVNPMLIAYHAEEGELPNRALNYWNLTGIYAAQVGSLTAMNMAMFRALEIMDLASSDTGEPLRAQEMSLRMHESLGTFNLEQNPDLAIQLLEWVFYYRKRENDLSKIIEPLGFLASAYENKGEFLKSLTMIDKALDLIDSNKYPLEYASLLINKMEYLFMLGRMQQARELMDEVIEPIAYTQGKQHNQEFFDAYLNARLILAEILMNQCDDGAFAIIEECLQFARERGLNGLNIALQLLQGVGFLRKGQYESCNREADGLLNAIESLEDSEWFLAQWGLLAMMYHCEMEDWESAGQLVLTVMSKAEEARDYHTWIMAHIYAGHISAGKGKLKEARDLLEQAIELSSNYRFARCALTGWRFLAQVELMQGNKEVAYEVAVKALEIANKPEIQHKYEAYLLSLLCAECLLAQGEIKPAGKLLEPLWPQVVKTRLQPLIATCAFEIGQLYKAMATDLPSDLSKKYLTRSVEFFLKSKGIWLELRHLPNTKRIDAVMPRL